MRGGSILFTKFLSEMKDPVQACPECGSKMRDLGIRNKDIVSLLGEGTVSRHYFGCKECGCHAIPKDEMLDIENTSFTPGVRRVAAKLAACDSFVNSSAAMAELCGIHICSKDTERIAQKVGIAIEAEKSAQIEDAFSLGETRQAAESVPVMYIEYDGTGVPVMKREAAGRKGKQDDGTAKTREVKLGCIFTQTETDEKGNPVRDENSTTYFGAIETSDVFGRRLYMEAVSRGVDSAEKVVVIGDGAKWIWNLANENFPKATQIIDLYHAKEHLWGFIQHVCSDPDEKAKIKSEWFALLENGDIQKLTLDMNQYVSGDTDKQKELNREVNYFSENAARMQYADFKKQGLCVGSGVIEASCKNVIGKRLKQSGMHWSVRGANAIIALRCALLSRNFDALINNARGA